MSPEEKKRMLHIRLDSEIHKDLRKAAAEYDISIQEIVADAAEKEVVHLETEIRLDRRRVKLEEKEAIEYKIEVAEKGEGVVQQEIEVLTKSEEQSTQSIGTVLERLEGIELAIFRLSEQVDKLKSLLVENE